MYFLRLDKILCVLLVGCSGVLSAGGAARAEACDCAALPWPTLVPGEELARQTIVVRDYSSLAVVDPERGASEARFCLSALAARSSYEARVSAPASRPASFSMRLERHACGVPGGAAGAGGAGAAARVAAGGAGRLRRLLNTERLVIATDADAQPLGARPAPPAADDALLELPPHARPDGAVAREGGLEGGSVTVLVVRAAPEGVAVSASEEGRAREVPFNIVVDPLLGGALPATAAGLLLVAPAVLAGVWCCAVPWVMRSSPLAPLLAPQASSKRR